MKISAALSCNIRQIRFWEALSSLFIVCFKVVTKITMNTTHTPTRLTAWIESLRLRTLPLALASVITGSALAAWQHAFTPGIAVLAMLTACLLQILSNMANDYGDAVKGSDTPERIGPLRGMQKGLITPAQMRRALVLVTALALLSGLTLLVVATRRPADLIGFALLGLLSVLAAITYTVGKRPYGYMGLGDISVLIFFGWISVGGTEYLQTHHVQCAVMLPATACGLLAAAVLNINNLRDMDTDRSNGKQTLAVRLGPRYARWYHAGLLGAALIFFALFVAFYLHSAYGWLFLLAAPALIGQARYVLRENSPVAMRPMLEKTVKGALITNFLFSLGVILAGW